PRMSYRSELEHGHFRANVEANLQQMADAATDVEPSISAQDELTARVPPIADRQQRRRQKWRLALPAVGVSRQDPSFVVTPDRQIDSIGIVTEDDRRPT